jgi:hypothetical protein
MAKANKSCRAYRRGSRWQPYVIPQNCRRELGALAQAIMVMTLLIDYFETGMALKDDCGNEEM